MAFCFFTPLPGEPATVEEALSGPKKEEWKAAMDAEFNSLIENGTWELVELPEGRRPISNKWVFNMKSGADGALEWFKSRLVTSGFQQKEKVDFKEIFTPIVKSVTLRTMLGVAAVKGWYVKQMDITTAFLNRILLEDIYMAQHNGYGDGTSWMCKLKNAIYGLNQAPRCWYEKLEEVLLSGGFKTSQADHILFLLREGEQLLLQLVHVDNILLFSPSMEQIERTQKLLMCYVMLSLPFTSVCLPSHVRCTSHTTPRADLLDEVKPPGNIKFVAATSGALLPVIGVGNAKVMGVKGELVGLGNVLLIEGLSANLLSVRRLQKSKAKVTFGPTSCRAKLGKLLLWDLEEKSSCIKDLWQLPIIPWNGKPPATAAAAATAKATARGEETAPTNGALDAVKKMQQPHGEVRAGVDGSAAWAKASPKLVKDGSLKGLEVKGAVKEIGSCPTCLETKFTKFPFSSSTGPAKALFALVHMDVVGPTRANSLSGSRYFLTIVDDHTRAVWVYPFKTKGEVAVAVVWAGSVAAQCDEDEIAHCYWAAVPEPKTLAEVLSGPDAEKWKQSVKEEYDSLLENETWELCELPPGKKAISSKLIFRHKYGPDGALTHYKSRLVAKGFQQTKGKDFDKIFAPVGKGTTLQVSLAMAANRGWRVKQMDITTAFLNGIILEELYMLQPEGLDDGSGKVCELKKAIYGLKQAPCTWYHKLEETLLTGGFKKTMIERVEEMLEMQLKCSKMGDVKYYLGIHMERDLDKGVLRLHQRKYCEGLAEKYGL
ncbi:unnamed protein product [Closterium sp. NIES-53]